MTWYFVLLISFNILTFVACKAYIEYPHDSCNVGNVAENDCNLCVCNNKTVYECYDKPCDAQNAIDEQHLKCQPKMVYVRKDIICICNKHGNWPHTKCEKALQTLTTTEDSVITQVCEPNSYVMVECNVCRCNSKGVVDTNYCTRNNCTQMYIKGARKALPLPKNVHGHCEPRNWYSLAPCQFCFCVNTNKLVCNTADFDVNKLQLGKYNLNVCGKELIKEAIELIPEDSYVNLRQGPVPSQTTTTTTTTTSTTTPVPSTLIPLDTPPPIQVREIITHKHREDQDVSTEYYEDEEEQKEPQKPQKPVNYKLNIAISAASTVSPYRQEANKVKASVNVKRNEEYEDAEEAVEETPLRISNVNTNYVNTKVFNSKPALKLDKNANRGAPPQSHKALRDRNTKENYVLDVFVPNVLESLFNLEMRKSMVKVAPSDNCVAGTIETVECNTCFCMKSGKKLCTDKKCE